MIPFIKHFKQMIPKQYQVIILAFLSLLALIIRVEGQADVVNALRAFLPIALVIFAVYVLETKQKTMVSHLVLFLFVFADYLGTFVRAIFSYNFSSGTFAISFSWQLILGLIACIYLILLILSYLLTEGFQVEKGKTQYLMPMILVFLYLYLRYAIGTATITILPIVVVFFINVPLALIALLLSLVISTPMDVVRLLIDGTIEFTSLFYWVIVLFSFYLIYLLIKELLSLVHKKPEIEESHDE